VDADPVAVDGDPLTDIARRGARRPSSAWPGESRRDRWGASYRIRGG